MWSADTPLAPEIITFPAMNTARGFEFGSAMGEAALGISTGPPAREGSLTLPRCGNAAGKRQRRTATILRQAEANGMGPPWPRVTTMLVQMAFSRLLFAGIADLGDDLLPQHFAAIIEHLNETRKMLGQEIIAEIGN